MTQRGSELITQEMAQRVIDTIKPTVHHNVNIMDAHGVIIAAVDPSRVGTHHAGALHAVRVETPVVITKRDDASGVRPGVNIPLWHEGAVRGVVGLTGDPEEVQPVAQVIALTVELLLAQERQIDVDLHRDAVARDVIASLSSGATEHESVRSRLAELGVAAPWSLSVALARPGSAEPARESSQRIRRRNRRPGVISTELFGAEWSVVGAGAYVKRRAGSRLIVSASTDSITRLEADALMLRRACAYPGLFPTVVVESGRASQGAWRWSCAEAIAHMPAGTVALLARTAGTLTQEQCRTILTLGQHSSANTTAAELFIHRSTLAQRMDQIFARTGSDPRVAGDLAELLLAVYARAAMGDLHIFGG